jgi:hypothetical protein
MEKSSDKHNYSFGVPSEAIWGSHILMGLFFVYVGYELIMKRKLSVVVALTLVVLGALGVLYHIHLWYEGLTSSHKQ